MDNLRYGFETTLENTSHERAVERVTEALNQEGFGVLTKIDIQATMAKKLGVAVHRYVILGACNPKLAHRALSSDPHIGPLLPCNVAVQETDNGGVIVSIADPRVIFALADKADVDPVAEVASACLHRVIDAVASADEPSKEPTESKETR